MKRVLKKRSPPSHYGVASDVFLSALLDNLPVALFCKDAQKEFRFTRWNKMAEKVFGLSAEAVLGKNDYDFFTKEQADFFLEKDKETLEQGSVVEILEEPVGKVWVHTLKVPVYDEEGNPRFLLGISEDITEKRLAQKELNVQRARSLASARMASLGEIAAGVAHEINNPLTIISGKANSIKNLAEKGESAEKIMDAAEKISVTVHRIAVTVESLRQFAREATTEAFVPKPLLVLIHDTLNFCRSRFKNHKIDLREDYEIPKDVTIDCRPGEISQLLLSILTNAFEAVRGVRDPWIAIEVKDYKNSVQIRITDNGSGISNEVLEKIFQPFFTTKDTPYSRGLGLSMAKGIAEAHEGSLMLDTSAAHTCFVVELPYRQSNGLKKAA